MNNIIIVIEGGVLQDVIGMPENYQYVLIDHDIPEGERGYKTEIEIVKLIRGAGTPLQRAARGVLNDWSTNKLSVAVNELQIALGDKI